MTQIITTYFVGFFSAGGLAILPAIYIAVKRAFMVGAPCAD